MERAEKIGLGVAVGGHALLLALFSLGAFQAASPDFMPKPVEVSLVGEPAEQTAAPDVSPEAPQASVAPEFGAPTDSPPPLAEPEPAKPEPTPPTPQPRPVEPVRTRDVAKPQPAKPTPAKPVPAKPAPAKPAPAKPAPSKPAPAKPASSSVPTRPAARPAATASASPSTSSKPARGSRLGSDFLKGVASDGAGKAPVPTAVRASAAVRQSIDVSIGAEVRPFWQRSAPSGIDVEQLVTVVEMRFNRDGSLSGTPRCVSQSGETESNANQKALHCERAIRSAQLAAPYKLPADYYDDWKVHRLTFRLNGVK